MLTGKITSLRGEYARSLTIAATGDITITGDVVRPGFNVLTDILTDDTMMGVTSGSDIRLDCKTLVSQTSCDLERKFVGVLSAPYGTIYNIYWSNSPVSIGAPGNLPRFYLYGAMIAEIPSYFWIIQDNFER